MKKTLSLVGMISILAVILALAAPADAENSKTVLFEGQLFGPLADPGEDAYALCENFGGGCGGYVEVFDFEGTTYVEIYLKTVPTEPPPNPEDSSLRVSLLFSS